MCINGNERIELVISGKTIYNSPNLQVYKYAPGANFSQGGLCWLFYEFLKSRSRNPKVLIM